MKIADEVKTDLGRLTKGGYISNPDEEKMEVGGLWC